MAIKGQRQQVTWPGGGQGVTVRQLATFVVLMALVFVLVPVGSWAAQVSQVFITDPTNQSNKAHVDGSGNLLVRGGVNVNNLPATQDVNVVAGSLGVQIPPATESRVEDLEVDPVHGSTQTVDIAPIDAGLITVEFAGDDQAAVLFHNDSPPIFFGIGDDKEPLGPFVTLPLTQAIPIDQITLLCLNQTEPCEITVTVVGS